MKITYVYVLGKPTHLKLLELLSKISGLEKSKAKDLIMKKVEEEMNLEIAEYIKDREDTERFLPDITEIFNRTLEIEGVDDVVIHTTNSTRENRYSIMIEMTLTPEGLERYDVCDAHKLWKSKYGDKLVGKVIFDCE